MDPVWRLEETVFDIRESGKVLPGSFWEWLTECVKPQSPQSFKRFFLNRLSVLCG